MDINAVERLKRDILNELKELMKECVYGWLNNQRDTLLLGLVGMIEQEKWKKEHSEDDNAVDNAVNELMNINDAFPELKRETGEEVLCEGQGERESKEECE
jgi:hypothetical protein